MSITAVGRMSKNFLFQWIARAYISIIRGTPLLVQLFILYFGLPVIGFAAQTYSTTGLPGVSANVLSNYGGNFNHKYMRNIVTNNPAPPAN